MALTNKDIEKLATVFVTKQDFTKGLAEVKSELTNQILTSQDKVMKRLNDIATDQQMSRLPIRRHDDQLEDHEKRLKTLETAKV